MHKISLLLTCLACVGHGRRVLSSTVQPRSSPSAQSQAVDATSSLLAKDRTSSLKALTKILLGSKPATAFNPSGATSSLPIVSDRQNHADRVPVVSMAGERGARGARLVGIGSAAPATVVPNAALEEVVETSDEWISQRTGIKSRHLLQK